MKKAHSIKYWFTIFLTIYSIFSIAIALLVSKHTLNRLSEDAAQQRYELLELYLEQKDITLRNAYYSLIDLSLNNKDLVALRVEENVSENALKRSALQRTLQSLTSSHTEITGYFLYVASDTFGNEYFAFSSNGTQEQIDNVSRNTFYSLVKELVASPDLQKNRWFVQSINGQNYLVCIACSNNSYTGCYVNMNSLIRHLDKLETQRGYSFFTDSSGNILTQSHLETERITLNPKGTFYQTETLGGEKYISINAFSSASDICLVALIASRDIFASFSPFFLTLLVALAATVLLLPVTLVLLWSVFNRSLSNLLLVIERIKAGNSAARTSVDTSISEMATVNQSFNEMMDEIEALKISVYEQQLKERQTYLDYLQIQIRPHFFLNCLNLIYSLAELKQYENVKKLSLGLVRYFRYLFHRSASLVTVRKELDHVQDYINIQQFRFPNGIQYEEEVEEELENALIPPISIQTFVENSVKYGRNGKDLTMIRIKVERHGEKMRVSVRDSGKGFPPDVLVSLNSGKRFNEDETHRIGITNVTERISLFYGEEGYARFYNNCGSVSEFTIPLSFEAKQEGEGDL